MDQIPSKFFTAPYTIHIFKKEILGWAVKMRNIFSHLSSYEIVQQVPVEETKHCMLDKK